MGKNAVLARITMLPRLSAEDSSKVLFRPASYLVVAGLGYRKGALPISNPALDLDKTGRK
jgi:hypothetical protein